MKVYSKCLLAFFVAIAPGLLAGAASAADAGPRERLLLDFGWKFHLSNDWGLAQNLAKAGSGYGPASTTFSDASWRQVNLPHDWAIELPFDRKADGAHGFRAVGPGFPENSIGWYRRTFALPKSDEGRRLWLELDGVFRDSLVYVNGWCVGRQESGYSGSRYDITDVANCGGDNVVAVRVDASQSEGWFYEGAGIYRHVWLVKTGPLAIAPDGVFVYSGFKDNIPAGPAEIHLQVTLANALKMPADATVTCEIHAPDGKVVATAQQAAQIDGADEEGVEQVATVAAPELWSPETPRLYKLVTTVVSGGRTVDQKETEFGIRTFAFDAEKGFLLNGRPYVLKGTCNHQDHAGVGAALPDGVQYFRIAKLKEMGANAYRSAHNPPTPELLEACDRLGMLVMDENRLVGSDGQHLQLLQDLVLRDRNHASVAIWSLGNEEFSVQRSPSGGRALATMQDLVKRLDPTRPVTVNADQGNEYLGFNEVIEVRGWSYHIGKDNMDAYHAAHPAQPNVGSEQGSTVTTRGIYAADPERGYMSAYDDNAQTWSNTAKDWWGFFAPRPWLSGGFIWTGFDYRGEPTPYSWPCINSHFGIFDTCGFPKDLFWYYQSWWTAQPVLHLMPHWNWAGREGQEIDVRAQSNCEEVELFLNGQSLGRQTMPRNSELKWKVPYAAGTLSAKGYTGGKVTAETKVETTGAAAAVQLAPDRNAIRADGEDVSVVAVSIVDDKGTVVPVAGNLVRFGLEGPGRIIGVGNGDPSCHEPDVYFATPTLRSIPVGGWRWQKIPDAYAAKLPELAPDFDDRSWAPADVEASSGFVKLRQHAVFRARFTATPEVLAAGGLELWFGRIEGDAKVYLNGEKLGPGADTRTPCIYNPKALLRPGENTVAVVVASWSDTAGVAQGVKLRLIDAPPPVAWSRSAFNGHAQVIVQSAKEAGTIRLTASAEGLKTATVELTTKGVTPRPALP
jgi:beta-galactosidase